MNHDDDSQLKSLTTIFGSQERHSILDDPTIDPELIRELWPTYTISALLHPNCPPDLWWLIAASSPIEAIASPAYPLMTLEDPSQWAKRVDSYIDSNLDENIGMLVPRNLDLFAWECLARVFSIYSLVFPEGEVPKNAMEGLHDLSQDKLSYAEYKAIVRWITYGIHDAGQADTNHRKAAILVAYALKQHGVDPYVARLHALRVVRLCQDFFGRTEQDEVRWQWHRLIQLVHSQWKELQKDGI